MFVCILVQTYDLVNLDMDKLYKLARLPQWKGLTTRRAGYGPPVNKVWLDKELESEPYGDR